MNTQNVKFKVSNADLIDYKRKIISRRITAKMIKQGKIERASHCEKCAVKYKTVAHHVDYGKPDQVVWLCNKCHGSVHKKGHELNPNSVKQTYFPVLWEETDYVMVNFKIPIENFIYIKKIAQNTGGNFSKLLRGCVLEKFPVEDNQLEFNFGGQRNNDANPQKQKRIYGLEPNEKIVHRQEFSKVQKLWPSGDEVGGGMDEVRKFLERHGEYSRKLQWSGIDRQEHKRILQA